MLYPYYKSGKEGERLNDDRCCRINMTKLSLYHSPQSHNTLI